jgi:hypothetical protein
LEPWGRGGVAAAVESVAEVLDVPDVVERIT